MRKFIYLLALLIFIPKTVLADGAKSTNFVAVLADTGIVNINTAIGFHKLTWNVSGTVSSCTVALDTSSDNINWSAGGAIAGQTCTSNGVSSTVNVIANYVRINMTAFSGTGSVSVTWNGYVNNPAGGSAFGTPPATPNGVTFTACETPSGGVAGTLGYCWPGITVTSQTGATYTLAAADRSAPIELNNAAMTVTIPDAGGTNFANGYAGALLNLNAAAVTVNNTSSSKFNEFGALTATLQTTFQLAGHQTAYFYTSPNNNWDVFLTLGPPTITMKSGSGAGSYTTTSSTLSQVDGVNLTYTVTVPTNAKMIITCGGTGQAGTATSAQINIGVVEDAGATATTGTAISSISTSAQVIPFSCPPFVFAGDGVSHTWDLRWKQVDNATTGTIFNSVIGNITFTPRIVFEIFNPSS